MNTMNKHLADHRTTPESRGNQANEEITMRLDRSNGHDVVEIRLGGMLQRGSGSHKAISPPLVSDIYSNRPSLADQPEGGRLTADCNDAAERLLQLVLDQHFSGGKHLMFDVDGGFYNYTGKLWQPVPDKWVEGRILDSLQVSALRTRQKSADVVRQVRSLLAAKVALRSDLFASAEDQHAINCANGELRLAEDGNFRPPSASSRISFTALPRRCLRPRGQVSGV